MTTEQPKKTLTVPMLIAIILVLIVCYLLANSINKNGGGNNTVTNHYASYRISGTAGLADITYENETGGTEQRTVGIPWTSASWKVQDGDFLYISAQNQGETGSVICEILIDGVSIKKSTSSGAYVIATCSGRY